MTTRVSRTLWTVTVGLPVLLGSAAAVALAGDAPVAGAAGGEPRISRKEVYSCDFKTELSDQWKLIGGKWDLKDGSLTQTDPQPADPTKAIILIGDNRDVVSRELSILAKLRLDSTRDGDRARAGTPRAR